MPAPPGRNGLDQQALEALAKVRLDLFVAEPSTIEPYSNSKISWKVTLPERSDVPVILDISGTSVAASGGLQVTPESTTSYQLKAQAGSLTKVLGTVTVQVDLAACIAPSGAPGYVVEDMIRYKVEKDKSGIRLRSTPHPVVVSIEGDRMNITLRLTDSVKLAPDPSIDIETSFALTVVPLPPGGPKPGIVFSDHDFHRLAPTDERADVDVSFPWYVWLIPGAMLGLPIAISDAEAKAYAKATKLVGEVVEGLDGWFRYPEVQPPWMDKHDASFHVNSEGEEIFWIRFCPAPVPEVLG